MPPPQDNGALASTQAKKIQFLIISFRVGRSPAARHNAGTPRQYKDIEQLGSTQVKVSIATLLRDSPSHRNQIKEFIHI